MTQVQSPVHRWWKERMHLWILSSETHTDTNRDTHTQGHMYTHVRTHMDTEMHVRTYKFNKIFENQSHNSLSCQGLKKTETPSLGRMLDNIPQLLTDCRMVQARWAIVAVSYKVKRTLLTCIPTRQHSSPWMKIRLRKDIHAHGDFSDNRRTAKQTFTPSG